MPTTPQMKLDDQGREIPDDTPIVIHLRTGPVTDFDRIREMVRVQMSMQAEANGMETFDDANDFDVDDDLFPVSPHEYKEETEAADLEAMAAERARQEAKKAENFQKKRRKADAEDAEDASGTPDASAGSEGGTPSPPPSAPKKRA